MDFSKKNIEKLNKARIKKILALIDDLSLEELELLQNGLRKTIHSKIQNKNVNRDTIEL